MYANNRDIDSKRDFSPEHKIVLPCTEIGIVIIFLLCSEKRQGLLSYTTTSLELQVRIVLQSTLDTHRLCGDKLHYAHAPLLAKNYSQV